MSGLSSISFGYDWHHYYLWIGARGGWDGGGWFGYSGRGVPEFVGGG